MLAADDGGNNNDNDADNDANVDDSSDVGGCCNRYSSSGSGVVKPRK